MPDGVAGARVTSGGSTEQVEARDNVIGAVLPFPYEAAMRFVLIRRPSGAA